MGQKFGEWESSETIGEGGQAHVLKVTHVKTGTIAALKRLKNSNRLGRFKGELEALQTIDHPNVIKVLDHDIEAAKPYFVMELIEGGTLAEQIPWQWGMETVDRLRVFAGIAEGVAAAHKAMIVHRDLKPDNILMRTCQGPAVVSDFGLCYIEDEERHTGTKEAVGPRLYMAPELEDGRADVVKPVSDVYSLGKVLWAMLAGEQVFSREKHREDKFNLVKRSGNDSMEHVSRLLDLMIVDDASKRLPDAGKVLEQLKRTTNLIKYDYRAVSAVNDQRCMYCGEGLYKLFVKTTSEASQKFGVSMAGVQDWRILACSMCGHVNIFRLEFAAKKKEWWGA